MQSRASGHREHETLTHGTTEMAWIGCSPDQNAGVRPRATPMTNSRPRHVDARVQPLFFPGDGLGDKSASAAKVRSHTGRRRHTGAIQYRTKTTRTASHNGTLPTTGKHWRANVPCDGICCSVSSSSRWSPAPGLPRIAADAGSAYSWAKATPKTPRMNPWSITSPETRKLVFAHIYKYRDSICWKERASSGLPYRSEQTGACIRRPSC